MAQIGYLDVPVELQELLANLISPTSNRRTGAVRKAGYIPSKAQVVKLTTRSLLPQISEMWAGLSAPQVAAWKAAAAVTKMNAWNLFVQDTAYRLKYGIAGLATPSLLHQYKVGRVEINAPAEKVVLAQFHPPLYYVSKKVRGNTTLREDVAISELLTLPLTIGCSYRANLTPTREDYTARFYAIISSSYQGRTIETEVGFNFNTESDWTKKTVTQSKILGLVRSYNLWIELDGVRGWFEWDNVIAKHSGTNYARDARCTDVNNELSIVNYQIEKSWEEQFLPTHTAFSSVYPADGIDQPLLAGYGQSQAGAQHYGDSIIT